jgi:hypothetical protein
VTVLGDRHGQTQVGEGLGLVAMQIGQELLLNLLSPVT